MTITVITHHFPECAYLRIRQIIGDPKANPPIPPIIPISRSAFLKGVKEGKYPQPIVLGPRTKVWALASILAVFDSMK